MSKSDDIMEALTKSLENKGVLVETTDNNLTTYLGMSNKRKASIVHPFYSEDEEQTIDVDQEVERLLSEVETQIRMGGIKDE